MKTKKVFARRPSKQEFIKMSAHIPSAIALPLTCLKQAIISFIVQELLGHKDVKTTMMYTHVLNRGPKAVRSPLDE